MKKKKHLYYWVHSKWRPFTGEMYAGFLREEFDRNERRTR